MSNIFTYKDTLRWVDFCSSDSQRVSHLYSHYTKDIVLCRTFEFEAESSSEFDYIKGFHNHHIPIHVYIKRDIKTAGRRKSCIPLTIDVTNHPWWHYWVVMIFKWSFIIVSMACSCLVHATAWEGMSFKWKINNLESVVSHNSGRMGGGGGN